MGNERLLNWVTVCAAILGSVGVLATLPLGNLVLSYSVAIGTGVAVLNLVALRRIGSRLLLTQTNRGRATAMFMLKLVLVIGGLWVLFQTIPIHALGLMGGLSAVVAAVMLGTLFGPAPSAEPDEVKAE